jgi:hypothetical protein
LAFVDAATRFMSGKEYEPFTGAQGHAPLSPEDIWTEFSAGLYRLLRIAEYTGAGPKAGGGVKKAGTEGEKLIKYLVQNIIARPGLSAFAAGYRVLTLLRPIIGAGASGAEAVALTAHWQLDRKLREAFNALGIAEDESYRVTEIMKAVLSRTAPVSQDGYSEPSPAEALILENYEEEDFRRILGVNLFEDVTWFNKEAFEETLFYAPFFLVLEDNGAPGEVAFPKTTKADAVKDTEAWTIWVGTLGVLAEQFRQAGEKSGYRLDKLLEALAEKGSAKTAKPRKPAVRKPASGNKK